MGENDMKPLQASFTAGELSPLLHARVDLARYMTGAAKLENFLVLPQGGIARRPGFSEVLATGSQKPNLVPFRFNSEDTALLAFDGTAAMAVIRDGQEPQTVALTVGSGAASELARLGSEVPPRYAQSGNMIFFAGMLPCTLTRAGAGDWRFERLAITDGPWRSGIGKEPGQKATALYVLDSDTWGVFFEGIANLEELVSVTDTGGSLIRLDFQMGGEIRDSVPAFTQNYVSETILARGTWEFITSGKNWAGTVRVQKSLDNGVTWYTVKASTKALTDDGTNVHFAGEETEEDVLYRVQVDMAENDSAGLEGYEFLVAPYIRSLAFEAFWTRHINGGDEVALKLVTDTHGVDYREVFGAAEADEDEAKEAAQVLDWRFGAWGEERHPRAVAFYQDRLVFAGSAAEPQTIWMSKTGDYKSFGMSDPIRDDDAITLTLAGGDSDGIHSLVAMTDLLAFTGSGEWRIAGSGEQGALSPKAVVAHLQTRIGSKPIQPLVAGSGVVFVQAGGTEVHVLGYNLQTDGYSGSSLSILSGHLFAWKKTKDGPYEANEIVSMAYQQTPDSILWFALADGSMATCTYQPEHEVAAWARQTRASGKALQLAALPSSSPSRGTDLYCVATGIDAEGFAGAEAGTHRIDRLGSRMEENSFSNRPSVLETLSVNFNAQDGSTLANKKLIPRVFLYALRSEHATAAPQSAPHKKKPVAWTWSPEMSVGEVMLDAGFEHGAALRIESVGDEPLTILAVVPLLTSGKV
jgi:hypothetical protein